MQTELSKMASLISEDTRSSILLCLMDGGAHPASELASYAKVKPQTASFHLSKLLEANIVSVEKYGRHRYFKLTNDQVAESIEQLLRLTPETPIRSFNESRERKIIHYARTCYDHLAGHVGVQVTQALLENGYLLKEARDFTVSDKGAIFFEELGIEVKALVRKRRAFARCCLDWSERQEHLAGSLGNSLLERFFEWNWIERIPSTRAIKITDLGLAGLKTTFQVQL